MLPAQVMLATQVVGSVVSIILMVVGLMAMVTVARRMKQWKKSQEAEVIDDDDRDQVPRWRRF